METIKKHHLGGIVFFQTRHLEVITDFYLNLGCALWLDQGGCRIFQFGNMLIGFCQREKLDDLGMITFYFDNKQEVDQKYEQYQSIAVEPPKDNPNYRIYHFFAQDPDGRNIEFQYFWDE